MEAILGNRSEADTYQIIARYQNGCYLTYFQKVHRKIYIALNTMLKIHAVLTALL